MANEVKIFDVLAHPCVSADYLGRGLECSFEGLAKTLETSQVKWACAVALENVGEYTHESFAAEAKKYDNIFPIAAFNPLVCKDLSPLQIKEKLLYLKELGFHAIKLHPRRSKFKIASEEVDLLFSVCEEIEFPVFLCTYYFGSLDTCPVFDSISNLAQKFPNLKFLLVHAGAVELMKFMELARAYKNILLDLSLTIMKYEGSSLDLDIQFLFKNFDRRICVGSDHPEYRLEQLAKRFNQFAEPISKEKAENIAYKNIADFLGLNLQTAC